MTGDIAETTARTPDGGSTLDVALHVIDHWPGARVLPVNGKYPAWNEVPHWHTDATADPRQAGAWFAGSTYGVGVTGILAIDGDDAEATRAQFGDTLSTGVRLRGNPDRCTWLFAQPADPFTDGKHDGGEVKGSGYVVLPPSRHVADGCPSCLEGEHGYEWGSTDWRVLPACPPALEALLDEAGVGRKSARTVVPVDEVPGGWLTDGEPCRSVRAVLDPTMDALATPGVSKHPLITEPVMALLRLGEQGHAGVREAVGDVHEAFLLACSAVSAARAHAGRIEFQRSLFGAAARIHADGLTDPYEVGCCGPDPSELDETVFGRMPVLTHVRTHAESLLVGPWAVLGSVLARVVAETPPWIRLPAYVGGDGSLNLYVALVDTSGAGKSSAHKAAATAFTGMDYAKVVPNGTGEGLLSSFMEKSTKADRDAGAPPFVLSSNPQVLMYVDEIGQLQVGAARSGSSIEPILRSMWNGEQVGTNNADPSRNRDLPAHAYRLGLVAGVQPELAGSLLSSQAAASGTAQRWLWLPTTNPFAPDLEVLPVQARRWNAPSPGGVRHIEFPPYVRLEVQRLRALTLRGVEVADEDRVKAHRMLAQMKVAAALGVLNESLVVDDETWAIAAAVMDQSDRTRSGVMRTLAKRGEAEAEAAGWRQAMADQGRRKVENEHAERCAGSIARLVTKHAEDPAGRHPEGTPCPKSCLSRALSSRDTVWRDAAIEHAERMDWIRQVGEHWGPGSSLPA